MEHLCEVFRRVGFFVLPTTEEIMRESVSSFRTLPVRSAWETVVLIADTSAKRYHT